MAIRGLAEVLACSDAGRLVDGWLDHPDRPDGVVGLPASLYRCPPCRARLHSPWLVTLGYHQTVVTAGCAEAASMMAWRSLTHRGSDSRDRVRWAWARLQPRQRAHITARPATADEVARFERMVWETEHRDALDTTH